MKKNSYDMKLYHFVEDLFDEQREHLSYLSSNVQNDLLPEAPKEMPFDDEGEPALPLPTLDESYGMEEFNLPTSEQQAAALGEYANSPIGIKKTHPFLASMTSYTIEDAIAASAPYRFTFAVIVYDPSRDKFMSYYSKHHLMRVHTLTKMRTAMRHFTYMLRKTFPDRFTPNSEEFVVAISSGDYAHVDINQLPYMGGGAAPVLHFGSAFRDTNLIPNLVAMPMPGDGGGGPCTLCFAQWASSKTVCGGLRSMHGEVPDGTLAYGDGFGIGWEDLKVRRSYACLTILEIFCMLHFFHPLTRFLTLHFIFIPCMTVSSGLERNQLALPALACSAHAT